MGRKIPKVASASLVLGAMGCGGGGGSHATAASVTSLDCRLIQMCVPYDFQSLYGSLSGCESRDTRWTTGLAHYTASCQQAKLDYYDCVYSKELAAADCSKSSVSSSCTASYDAMMKACP